MLTEKNFSAALKAMNFVECGNFFEKTFADGVTMKADLKAKKLFYPAQIQGGERNTDCDKSHRENLVVFECVNRLLDKGYNPADIELERQWQLGHTPKGGRADICVSSGGKVLFIVECKTFGDEFNHEIDNMLADGGQLFSYWQQEQSCRWLMLYASNFADNALTFNARCVSCDSKFYGEAQSVPERFKIWSERFDKFFLDDVIFHAETVAYKIGVRPLRKRYLRDIKDLDENKSVVNQFEEILRHNQVSDKENAFNRLTALFICKVVDEARTSDDGEVSFQFKFGADTRETFQDRLQKLYADGMKKFMGEDIFYLPEDYPDKLFKNFADDENHDMQIKDLRENFRRLKFFTNNEFAFVEVSNEKLFRLNAKILVEVVRMFQDYRIIGSRELQLLGDLFEQLLSKGFKQDEGQFFTPTPIAQFIWDSLPLDEIVARLKEPPKVIDYACGAGHFLTEGFKAVNDCFSRNNKIPPVLWERNKLFGVEKDYRLARVSKVSLFMHGAGDGKIKFGDGLENYPDENISPATFDVLVANPPYSVKGFKAHLKLTNEFEVLDKISNSGSEIETLFAERISQLVKPKGVAAVILPSSILNKDGKSFIAARESLLKKFFLRAIVQLGSKTFGATSTSTVVFFLERFDEPPRVTAEFEDIAETILSGKTLERRITREVFAAYTKKIGVSVDDYRKFIARDETCWLAEYFAAYPEQKTVERRFDKVTAAEREKIIYFGLTFRQTTLIVTAPDDNKEQEIFLGYGWSNAKGREGIVHKKRGGLLFDNKNHVAENTIAAVIRAAFRSEQVNLPALKKYFRYATLSDMLNFDAVDFTKKITTGTVAQAEYTGKFPTVKLGEHVIQIRGVSYKPNDLHRELSDDSIILLRANNISDGKINHDKLQFVSREKVSDAQIIRKGDILMSASSGSLEHVGKAALCNEFVAGETFGAFCKVVRSTGKLMPEYIAIYLSSPDCRKIIANVAKGANINNLRNEHIDNLKIPLPPVDVQQKIVDDFKALDAQIDSWEQTIQSLDADVQKKFNTLFADLTEQISLEKISESIETGSRPKGGVSDFTDGVLSLGGEHINNSTGYLNLTNPKFVPKDFFDATASGRISRNDILICKDGALSGKVALVRDELDNLDALANEHVFVLKNSNETLQWYLFHYLFFDAGQRQLKSKITGMAQGGINRTNLLRISVPLPPLELQEEFASYVSTCEAMKQSARSRRDELIHARGELVKKYFR